MGHYSELRIGKCQSSLKGEIPAVWSFLFQPNDYFEVLGSETLDPPENIETDISAEDSSTSLDDEDQEDELEEEDKDEWFSEIGYKTTCEQAKRNLDQYGYGIEFFAELYDLLFDDLQQQFEENLDWSLTEAFDSQASSNEARIQYFQDFKEVSRAEDMLDLAHWMSRALYSQKESGDPVSIVLPSGNVVNLSAYDYKEWLDNGPEFGSIDLFFFQKHHLFPSSIGRLSGLIGEEWLFHYREVVTLVYTRLLLEATNDKEEVILDLHDIIETREEVRSLHSDLAEEVAKKVHVYNRTFRPIATRMENVRNQAAKRKAKSLMAEAWEEPDKDKRGGLLEDLIAEIFSHPNLKVLAKRFDNGDEEIDLVLENGMMDGFWTSLNSPIILVECKNWKKQVVGAPAVRDFETKIRNHKKACRLGLLFSLGKISRDCRDHLLRMSREDYTLMLINRQDLEAFLSSGQTLSDWLKELIARAK